MSSSSKTAFVTLETIAGVARVVLCRPETLNALNPAMVFQAHQAVRQALADPAVRGLIVAGAGRAFAAGADVAFFLRNLESSDVARIVRFTEAGHALLNDLDHAPKPVVACVHGLALGGGLELALACDRIFAAPQASLGFPETGIGLYPGLGGTQRTPRKIGPGLAKWLLYTAKTLSANAARTIGLVDRIVPREDLEAAAQEAILAGLPPEPAVSRPAEYARLEEFFLAHCVDDLAAGRADPQGDAALLGAVRRVRTKAPLALRFVERFIDRGASLPLAEALQLELAHLDELFRTSDAREGLRTLGRSQPAFQGR